MDSSEFSVSATARKGTNGLLFQFAFSVVDNQGNEAPRQPSYASVLLSTRVTSVGQDVCMMCVWQHCHFTIPIYGSDQRSVLSSVKCLCAVPCRQTKLGGDTDQTSLPGCASLSPTVLLQARALQGLTLGTLASVCLCVVGGSLVLRSAYDLYIHL